MAASMGYGLDAAKTSLSAPDEKSRREASPMALGGFPVELRLLECT
jgi:hypothetical protein